MAQVFNHAEFRDDRAQKLAVGEDQAGDPEHVRRAGTSDFGARDSGPEAWCYVVVVPALQDRQRVAKDCIFEGKQEDSIGV